MRSKGNLTAVFDLQENGRGYREDGALFSQRFIQWKTEMQETQTAAQEILYRYEENKSSQ